MIKFFRNLRRQLLRENRFTRYLIYAVGEIILVVIGILIALQVNNWNQKQKLIIQRKGYSESIINDLVKDSIGLSIIIDQSARDSAVFSSLENRLKNHPIDYDTIQKMFRYEFPMYVRPDYSFNNNTLISIIEDQRNLYPKGLVDSLVLLVKVQKDFERMNEGMIDKYFDMLNRKSDYPFHNYFFDGGKAVKDSIWAKVDKQKMLADFQQLADWKKALIQLTLQASRAIQKISGIMKNRLVILENND